MTTVVQRVSPMPACDEIVVNWVDLAASRRFGICILESAMNRRLS